MTGQGGDVLAWLDAALTRREEAARGAGRSYGPKWVRPIDTDKVRVSDDDIWFQALSDEIAEHVVYNDPESVLRRCAADRKLLASHQPAAGVGYGPDDDDTPGAYGEIASACTSCGTLNEWAVHFPCHVVRTLAEGYGWTDPTDSRPDDGAQTSPSKGDQVT
jgi:hypothetical protein